MDNISGHKGTTEHLWWVLVVHCPPVDMGMDGGECTGSLTVHCGQHHWTIVDISGQQ